MMDDVSSKTCLVDISHEFQTHHVVFESNIIKLNCYVWIYENSGKENLMVTHSPKYTI